MRISYDREADALSIIFEETTVTTQETVGGVAIEYDANGKVAGIEILDAMTKLGDRETLTKILFETVGPVDLAA